MQGVIRQIREYNAIHMVVFFGISSKSVEMDLIGIPAKS